MPVIYKAVYISVRTNHIVRGVRPHPVDEDCRHRAAAVKFSDRCQAILVQPALHQDAIDLLDQCRRRKTVPPTDLVFLISDLLGKDPKHRPDLKRPELSDKQWRALDVEAQDAAIEDDRWVFRTKLASVASAAGVTGAAVHQWRGQPEYQRGLVWAIVETHLDPSSWLED